MKIIVIGAGIAGLAAAHELSLKGHQVEIYESSNRAGGRAITLKRPDNDDRYDAGSQYFHSSYQRALKLINHNGLGKNLKKVKGYTRFFNEPPETGSFDLHHRYPWINPIGISGNIKLALFLFKQLSHYQIDPYKINLDHSCDYKNIRKITNNPDVIKYIVKPLTLAGGLTLPDINEMSQLHLIRLIKIVISSDYLCLSSGNSSLHDKLASNLIIHYENPIECIIYENHRITGIKSANSHHIEKADHVIIAVPAPCAAKILPQDWQEEINFLNGILIPPFTLLNFFLDRPLEKNVWSYMMPEQQQNIMMCTDAAQKNPSTVPSGKSILQAWPCYPVSQDLAMLADNELINICINELKTYFPMLSEWIEYSEVTRHQYGVPQFNVGHNHRATSFFHAINKRQGISFCGDYFTGGYMESALWSVENAIDKLEKDYQHN